METLDSVSNTMKKRKSELNNSKEKLSKTKRYKLPEYLNAMNEIEKEINHKIIRNMNKRINYLRNPRFAIKRPLMTFNTVLNKEVEKI